MTKKIEESSEEMALPLRMTMDDEDAITEYIDSQLDELLDAFFDEKLDEKFLARARKLRENIEHPPFYIKESENSDQSVFIKPGSMPIPISEWLRLPYDPQLITNRRVPHRLLELVEDVKKDFNMLAIRMDDLDKALGRYFTSKE